MCAGLAGITGVVILAACSSPPSSAFTPSASGSSRTATKARAWMSPLAKQSRELLYLSNSSNPPAVYVYSYPQAKLVGTLTGFSSPGAECADRGGHVWITDNNSTIVEYAHGGSSPIVTLSDPDYFPIDCSVDPVTGNLAVTNEPVSGRGNVAVYKKARGNPTTYFPNFLPFPLYCGYDRRGNLFVDGIAGYNQFQLAELPIHNSGLFPFSINQSIGYPGGVLWDGTHLAVLDSAANEIYEFAISGNQGTEVGSTPLGESEDVVQFWIASGKVAGGDGQAAYLWPYPAGGNPIKVIVGLSNAEGAAVSERAK